MNSFANKGREYRQHSQLQSSKLYNPTIVKNSQQQHATSSEQGYAPKKRRQSNDDNLINNDINQQNNDDEYWKHGNEQLNKVLDAALYALKQEGSWQDLATK